MRSRIPLGVVWLCASSALAQTAAAPAVEKVTIEDVAAKSTRADARTFDEFERLTRQEVLGMRFTLNTFGNVGAYLPLPGPDGQTGGPLSFRLGNLGLLAAADLSDHIEMVSELVFETGPSNGVGFDLERLFVSGEFGPLTLRLGRMHTEIGYWNTAYHHGAWLQTPIQRPTVVRFEDQGGLIPNHTVGASADLKLPVGVGEVHLVATVGNGRGRVPDEVLMFQDYNPNKMFALSAFWQSDTPDRRIRFGLSGLYDKTPAAPEVRSFAGGAPLNEVIVSGHAVYDSRTWLAIFEGHWISHSAESTSFTEWSPFLLVGRRFASVLPYVLVEWNRRTGPGPDPFYAQDLLPDVPPQPRAGLRFTAGTRFRLSEWSSLKLEYGVGPSRAGSFEHAVQLDVSFGI